MRPHIAISLAGLTVLIVTFFVYHRENSIQYLKSFQTVEFDINDERIQEAVRERVKKELKYQKSLVSKIKTKLAEKEESLQNEYNEMKKELTGMKLQHDIFESETPKYSKQVFTYANGYDSNHNVNIYTIILNDHYGDGRNFDDFIRLLDSIEINKQETTLSFLVNSHELGVKVTEFAKKYIEDAIKSPMDYFSKIVILESEFLESQISISRGDRHKNELQAHRRKILAKMRNFLVFNTFNNEKYALFIDCDVVEVPSDLFKLFVRLNKDIAVVRIDNKSRGRITAEDYDKNTWLYGERLSPTQEEDELISKKELDFYQKSATVNINIHLLDIGRNLEKYHLTKDREANLEIDSVGGALLFAKTEIFKQGVTFPPYFVVGTKWGRFDGWDGIETEGLCYQAKAIGYKCWGFPNIVAYHT